MSLTLSPRVLAFSILLLFGVTAWKSIGIESSLARNYGHPAQALYAAIAGQAYAMDLLRQQWGEDERLRAGGGNGVFSNEWQSLGGSPAQYRLLEFKRAETSEFIPIPFLQNLPSFKFRVEGQSGNSRRVIAFAVSVVDIPSHFAVYGALDGVLSGLYLLDAVKNHLLEPARDFLLTEKFLSVSALAEFIKTLPDRPEEVKSYFRHAFQFDLHAIAGPVYCRLPVILNNATLFHPLFTEKYFYVREGHQPEMVFEGLRKAIPTSPELLLAQGKIIEPAALEASLLDGLSDPLVRAIAPPFPEVEPLRATARREGIYIDPEGAIHVNGKFSGLKTPLETLNLTEVIADSSSTEVPLKIQDNVVTLFSETKFGGYSTLGGLLQGSTRIVFSENSVQMRGTLENSILVFTPHRIYFTGSTSSDPVLPVPILYAARGCHLLLTDLHQFLLKNPDKERHARAWELTGAIGPAEFRHFLGVKPQLPGRGLLPREVAIQGSLVSGRVANPFACQIKVKHRKPEGSLVVRFLPSFNITHQYAEE